MVTVTSLVFCFSTFKRRYAYNAVSFAAFDAHGDTYVIFPAETSARRELFPGRVLVTPDFSGSNDTIQHLASKAFSLLAQLFALAYQRSAKAKNFTGTDWSEPPFKSQQ